MPLAKFNMNKGSKLVQNHCIPCIEVFFSLLRGGISLKRFSWFFHPWMEHLCSCVRTTLNNWGSVVYTGVRGSPSLTEDVFCNAC